MDKKFVGKIADVKNVLEIAALIVGGVEGGFKLKGFVESKMNSTESDTSTPTKKSWKEKRAEKKAAKTATE